MRRKLIASLMALAAVSVGATAALVAAVCLSGGAQIDEIGSVILIAAAVFAVCVGAGSAVILRLTRLPDPEPNGDPDYAEYKPLRRRIAEQRGELRAQREALEDRENKLAAITENMTEGLVLLDSALCVALINRAAAALLGVQENAVGRHIVAIAPDVELQAAVHTAMGGAHAREIIDMGSLKVQLIANPVMVDGAARGVVLMLFDVTERMAAEEMRREFSANVSHELKTPITSISGYAELMMTGMARAEDVPALSARIFRESRRLIALTDDIMKLSKLDEGGTERHTEEVELRSAASQVCDRLAERAREAGVSLELLGDGASVMGDGQLIDEMLTNLCENAIKYNRPDGHVTVTVGRRAGVPCVTVEDDGIGIAPEHLERIYERFYRVDKSHSKETGGTGLGLSIVKHAAAWHGASIETQSAPGRGTRISIIFDGRGQQK